MKIKNVTFITLLLVLSMLLLEILIRFTKLYQTQSEKIGFEFSNPYIVPHKGHLLHHLPNITANIQTREFSYTHHYNQFGHRENSNTDTLSILALGDSFTEGIGAPQDSTWPFLLSKMSNKKIYNAGIQSSDVFYNIKDFTTRFQIYKPQAIIFLLNYSDIYDVTIRGGNERFKTDGSTSYKKEKPIMSIYERSHLFRFVLHLVLQYDFMLNSPYEREQNTNIAVGEIVKLLKDFKSKCEINGIKMYVFLHPLPHEYYKHLDSRLNFKDFDNLDSLLKEQNINCVNLRKSLVNILSTPEDWKEVSWPIDGHFNSKGYKLLATLINQEISK